jgi:prevent-host-death family protein
MKQVTYGMRELQANLGEAIRAAQRGDQVLVTSRGRVVAAITAARKRIKGEPAVQRKLRRMAAEGRIRLGKPGRIKPFEPLPIAGLTDQLLRDRRR